GAVGADRGAAAHARGLVFVFARNMAARIGDVGEDHRRAAKHIVFEDDAGIHRNIVLNLDVVADLHVGRYDDVLSDIAGAADPAVFHDVGEVPDLGPRPDDARGIYVARFVYKVIFIFH